MLGFVCILESLDLTGLELHEWFGFALCPLVLIHVIWQWPWFVTQFRKFPSSRSRVRINLLLNALLLVLMSAVLLSGVFNSSQAIALVGERFGSVRVWREMHNWLNFTLLVWVALHLGLNWDWVLGIITRRHRDKAAAVEPTAAINAPYRPWAPLFRRGLAVLAASILSTGATYLVMHALTAPKEQRSEFVASEQARSQPAAPPAPLLPRPRPILLPHGFEQISVVCGLVLTLALVGRYLFRLRL